MKPTSLEAQPRMCSCPCHGPVFFGEHTTECQASRDSNHLHTLEAHPSAGQSDASLRDIDPTVLLHAAGLKHLYDKLVESRKESAELRKELIAANEQIEEFDARLAESRATMREEAAKVADSHMGGHDHSYPDGTSEYTLLSPCTLRIANQIRSLPANASALDARDARVRLEAIAEAKAVFMDEYCNHDSPLIGVARGLDAISVLAQRSAEKGKGQ